jgi:hypothetical protein
MNGANPLTPSFQTAKGDAHAPLPDKAERVLSRCDAHYEKHRDKWIAKRYETLLLKEGTQPALRPSWAQDDRKAHLYRAATSLVQRKQQMRLQKINTTARRMMGYDRDGIGR